MRDGVLGGEKDGQVSGKIQSIRMQGPLKVF